MVTTWKILSGLSVPLIMQTCHPHLLVAHTTKGKGVSFMEGVAKWHHGVPSNEQYEQAIQEISERIKDLEYN